MNKLELLTQEQLLDICGFMFGAMYYLSMHDLAEIDKLLKDPNLSDDEKRIHKASKYCQMIPLFEYMIPLLEQTNIHEYVKKERDPFARDILEMVITLENVSKKEIAQASVSIYRALLNDFYQNYNCRNEDGEKIESHLGTIKAHLKTLLKK